MATNAESFASVALTDFHNHPGTVVDQSQHGPVVLTKNRRRYAAVVSIDYLDRAAAALEALHANRRVLTSETALLRKSGPRQQLAFEGIQLRDTLSLRLSERGEAVEDGRTDLDFSDLAIEVSSHDAFPQQLETMHFRLDQTALVISAPSLPDWPPEPPA